MPTATGARLEYTPGFHSPTSDCDLVRCHAVIVITNYIFLVLALPGPVDLYLCHSGHFSVQRVSESIGDSKVSFILVG